MFKMSIRTECCHLCNSDFRLKKDKSLPPVCPVCGTDLTNPGSESIQDVIRCEHIKGALGIGTGNLFITNLRIFWLREVEEHNAFAELVAKGLNKGQVSIYLDDIDRLEDCRKLLRRGVTVHTKSSSAYNFFIPNLGNPKILKEALSLLIK